MTLYLISTPIGNLGDITYRAVEILKSCDYILCEDTRHSSILCRHYDITSPRRSYHKFNEARRESQVLEDLENGKNIALISDAGTPGIADPGMRLVKQCKHVEALPGPCAVIQALVLSGLNISKFQFVGFLPKKLKLHKQLLKCFEYDGVSVCYESPHRLIKTLKAIVEIDPDKEVVVARELTKKFETIHKNNAAGLLEYFETHKPRGEIVILV
jgi:16S rRNA (cytidine1402-2'-O)-methyltransferase